MALLPQFNFKPIIAPFTPLATEEFANTTNVLNQNYDTALENMSKSEQALAALQAAGYQGDQAELQRIKDEYNREFSNIHSRGDYENQLTATKRLASRLGQQILPIAQRKQQFDADLTNAYANKDIIDKDKYVRGYNALESKSPTLKNINGQLINTYDPSRKAFLDIKDVNLYERMKGLLAGHDNTVSNFNAIKDLKDSQGNPLLQTLRNTSIEEWKKEDIDKLANEIADGDAEIQAYRNKLNQLQQLGEETGDENLATISFEDELAAAIGGVSDFYKVRKVRSNDQIIQNYTRDSGSGSSPKPEKLFVHGNEGVAFKVNEFKWTDLNKGIDEINKELKDIYNGKKWENLTPEQQNRVKELNSYKSETKKLQQGVYDQVERELPIEDMWNSYNKVLNIDSPEVKRVLNNNNAPKTKEEYLEALRNGTFTEGILGQILNSLGGVTPKNVFLDKLIDQSNKYKKVLDDKLKNYESNSNLTTLTSSNSGEFNSYVGESNKLSTQDWNNGSATFKSALTGVDLRNTSKYLDNTYDGRDSTKDEIVMTENFTANGKMILQLNIKDEDGVIIGREPIILENSTEARNRVEQMARQMINTQDPTNVRRGYSLLSNMINSPEIKSKVSNINYSTDFEQLKNNNIEVNLQRADGSTGKMKIGKYKQGDEIYYIGLKQNGEPYLNENGNPKFVGTSEEDLSYQVFTSQSPSQSQ